MMAKSIIGGCKAGKKLDASGNCSNEIIEGAEPEPRELYAFLKRISGHLLRLIREIIWLLGRYDTQKMKRFIEEFEPDIFFQKKWLHVRCFDWRRLLLNCVMHHWWPLLMTMSILIDN